MRSTRVGAALISVLTAMALAAPASAASAPPAPTLRSPAASVDAAATWERESGCDQTEKKGPRRLRKLLRSTYGLMASNILRPCSAADSGHEEGRALDWMVNVRDPAQKEIADAFLGWLQAPDEYGNPSVMARRLGIQYVIWNNQMWQPSSSSWSAYSSCAKRKMRKKAYDNACHRNHVHVSFSWDGALGRTSFYTGYVACPEPVAPPEDLSVLEPPVVEPAVVEPAVVEPAEPVLPVPVVPVPVAVEPTKALRTKGGFGLATGRCKVHPDVPLEFAATGLGPVPAEGVVDVTLAVTVLKPDAATELRMWPTSTDMPLEPVLATPARVRASATVTVPVGADGRVRLQLTGGMAHVAVYVTGYSAVPPPLP